MYCRELWPLVAELFPRSLEERDGAVAILVVVEHVGDHVEKQVGLAELAEVGLREDVEELIGLAGPLKRHLHLPDIAAQGRAGLA